jgi:hypothetical protein
LNRKRGKVREQEERVNGMIKSTTMTHHAHDEYKYKMSSALQEKEREHERLLQIPEDEIDYQTESEKYLKQFQVQTEQMEVLECECRFKSDEMDKLRVELEKIFLKTKRKLFMLWSNSMGAGHNSTHLEAIGGICGSGSSIQARSNDEYQNDDTIAITDTRIESDHCSVGRAAEGKGIDLPVHAKLQLSGATDSSTGKRK